MLIDIAKIIIKYVAPNELIPFFLLHNVDLRIRFRYDAFNICNVLNVISFNNTFKNFPNVIITSLFLEIPSGHTMNNIQIDYNELRRIKIMCDDTIDITKFAKCVHLRVLMLAGTKCINGDIIYGLNKLRHLRLPNWGWSYNLTRLAHDLPKLRRIEMPFKDVDELVHFKKLRNIRFKAWDYDGKFITLSELRCLDISFFKFTIMPDLSGYHNLCRLIVFSCSNLKTIDTLHTIANLRHVEIWFCHKLESITNLKKCAKLQTLKLQYCHSLTTVGTATIHMEISSCPNLTSYSFPPNHLAPVSECPP